MLQQNITLLNKLGLHARASVQLINHVGRFSSKITIQHQNRQIDAKDILQVMSLAAAQGTEITLMIDGDDEQAAMTDLTNLIQNRFGEAE